MNSSDGAFTRASAGIGASAECDALLFRAPTEGRMSSRSSASASSKVRALRGIERDDRVVRCKGEVQRVAFWVSEMQLHDLCVGVHDEDAEASREVLGDFVLAGAMFQ